MTREEWIDLGIRAINSKHFHWGPGITQSFDLKDNSATGGIVPDLSTPGAVGELLFMARKVMDDDAFCVISAQNLKGEIRWGWQGVGSTWDALYKSEQGALVAVLESF